MPRLWLGPIYQIPTVCALESIEPAVVINVSSKARKLYYGGKVWREPEPALQFVAAAFSLLTLPNIVFKAQW